MKNITVLQLAEKIMVAHNETCSETFKDIELNIEDEILHFDVWVHAIGTPDMICDLLNLTLHIGVNSDPQSDKALDFYIT
jgi:hypothetical protein